MQITEITVSWNETCSLGNYSNVRPGLTLKATLGPDEDPDLARNQLMAEVRTYVQELVDQALEADDKPAKYSTDPRYDVLRYTFDQVDLLLIVPTGSKLGDHHHPFRVRTKQRIGPARKAADQYYRFDTVNYRLLESPDGDLAAILDALDAARAEQQAARERQMDEWDHAQQADIEEREAELSGLALPGEPDPYDEGDDDDQDDEE